jgi:hypothetical protein
VFSLGDKDTVFWRANTFQHNGKKAILKLPSSRWPIHNYELTACVTRNCRVGSKSIIPGMCQEHVLGSFTDLQIKKTWNKIYLVLTDSFHLSYQDTVALCTWVKEGFHQQFITFTFGTSTFTSGSSAFTSGPIFNLQHFVLVRKVWQTKQNCAMLY